LFARDGLDHTLGMCVDSSATIATAARPPRHRSPRATEDGSGIANPGLNRYIHHGSEPPRSKLGQTWFIDQEAHLLKSLLLVNYIASTNRYSETIPKNDVLRGRGTDHFREPPQVGRAPIGPAV